MKHVFMLVVMSVYEMQEYGVMKIPMLFNKCHHIAKNKEWCAVIAWRITGLLFFHQTVNLHWYGNDILDLFFSSTDS